MRTMGAQRVITHNGWKITQVAMSDGTWWNMTVERIGVRPNG